jgi:hypothetical protein
MAATLFTDLSGAGVLDFGFAEFTGYWHTKVTNFGSSHPVEMAGVLRYLDLGWIAPVEHDPDPGSGMSGDFAMSRTFLEFELQTHDFKTLLADIAGASGVAYNLRLGVVIDLAVGIP